MPLGKCALCQDENIELRNSHIISKFGLKALRQDGLQNPNPVIVDKDRHFQSSHQIKEYLLCNKCEQYFANGCEKYVSALIYNENGDCPLYKLLGYSSKVNDVLNPPEPQIIKCNQLDTDSIIKFAISIFWRVSISKDKWADVYSLGKKYNEICRAYLHDEIHFPHQTVIYFNVIDQPRGLTSRRFDRAVTVPSFQKLNGYHQHGFAFNGLYFHMYIGEQIPEKSDRACLHHSDDKVMMFIGAMRLPLIKNMIKLALISK